MSSLNNRWVSSLLSIALLATIGLAFVVLSLPKADQTESLNEEASRRSAKDDSVDSGLVGMTISSLNSSLPIEGMVVTHTRAISIGSESEWVTVDLMTTTVSEYDEFVSTIEALGGNPTRSAISEFRRNGDRWLRIERDENGVLERQVGRYYAGTSIPEFVRQEIDTRLLPHRLDDSLWKIQHDQHIAISDVDLSEIVAAGAGHIVEQGNTDMAIPATVVDVQAEPWSEYSIYRYWIDEEYGVKLRIEKKDALSETLSITEIVGYELDVDVSGVGFDVVLEDNVDTSYYEAQDFDENTEGTVEMPGVSGLLYPTSLPISGTLSLDSATYITGTNHLDWGWVVTQELSGANQEYVAVLQGDDRAGLPYTSEGYWPPAWENEDPTTFLGEQLRNHSAFTFGDATPVDVYECSKEGQLPSSRVPELPCDFLVTWVDGVNNRVVFLAEGFSRVVTEELAEAYRDASP